MAAKTPLPKNVASRTEVYGQLTPMMIDTLQKMTHWGAGHNTPLNVSLVVDTLKSGDKNRYLHVSVADGEMAIAIDEGGRWKPA